MRGAFILAAYGALAVAVAARRTARPGLAWSRWWRYRPPLLAAGTAGYTAYLFGQCEGRDLWQTPLLLPVLLAQAVAAGAASLLVLAPLFDLDESVVTTLLWTLLGGVVAIALVAFCELSSRGSAARRAGGGGDDARPIRRRFWLLGVGVGLVVPMVAAAVLLAAADDPTGGAAAALAAVAGLATVIGLFGYEDAFVRAGQAVPLS